MHIFDRYEYVCCSYKTTWHFQYILCGEDGVNKFGNEEGAAFSAMATTRKPSSSQMMSMGNSISFIQKE